MMMSMAVPRSGGNFVINASRVSHKVLCSAIN